ncbi:unnamed protein product [Phytophthora fragariaefolia]|uniref:Unnamed protein product n=1 Tax=Phytophthora fragariaefolia TaxID=1490495 RepID=A0A9W6YK39_9STRA|nr:unnamed protein product [Phytophthora fragariaefolia]
MTTAVQAVAGTRLSNPGEKALMQRIGVVASSIVSLNCSPTESVVPAATHAAFRHGIWQRLSTDTGSSLRSGGLAPPYGAQSARSGCSGARPTDAASVRKFSLAWHRRSFTSAVSVLAIEPSHGSGSLDTGVTIGRRGGAAEPAAGAEAASTPATCLQQSTQRPNSPRRSDYAGLDTGYLPFNTNSVGLAITALE